MAVYTLSVRKAGSAGAKLVPSKELPVQNFIRAHGWDSGYFGSTIRLLLSKPCYQRAQENEQVCSQDSSSVEEHHANLFNDKYIRKKERRILYHTKKKREIAGGKRTRFVDIGKKAWKCRKESERAYMTVYILEGKIWYFLRGDDAACRTIEMTQHRAWRNVDLAETILRCRSWGRMAIWVCQDEQAKYSQQ